MASYRSAEGDTAGNSQQAGSSVDYYDPHGIYAHPSSLPPPLPSYLGEGVSPVIDNEERDEYWDYSVTYYETSLEILRKFSKIARICRARLAQILIL